MESTRAEGPFRPTKLTLVAMLLTSMLMLMGGAAVAPALPLIQAYFPDSSEFAVSLIITLPSLAVAVTGMGIGIIADRFGKVRTLVVSLAIFTIAGVAGFFVDDLNVMLVMRFVLGVGIGGLSAAVTALMAEYYTGASRVKVLGYQSAAMGIGALVLESTGGWLAGFSWREPFLVYLIGVPIILLCVLSMREPSPAERREEHADTGRKANMRLVAVCYLAVFMCQMIFFLIPTKLPTFLEDPNTANYISTSMVGVYLGITGIVNAIVAVFYRRIVSHIRPFMVMACGFAVIGFGMAILLVLPDVYVVMLTMILAGAGVGLITPAVTNTLAGEATGSYSGKIMGGYSTFMNFGQFAISLVSVPLLAYVVNDSITDLCALMGFVSLFIALLFVLYCAKDRRFASAATGHRRPCSIHNRLCIRGTMQVEAFKALSDQNRLRIVEMLRGGELCACKILEALEITQPTLSHHMAILQRCGLVRVRRSGQWSHYSLDPGAFRELSAYLSSLADDSEASGGPVKIDDCRCIYIDNHL